MTKWLVGVLCLLLADVAVAQPVAQEVPPGTTPRQVSGKKSATGITVTAAAHGFTLELPGKHFQALSSDRLIWLIDAVKIELLVARRSPLLPDTASDAEMLRDYHKPLQTEHLEAFALANGSTGVLWNSLSRVTGAAVIRGSVVVLTATEIPPAAQPATRDYLKRALSTLRPAEVAGPAAADANVQTAGMPLQGQLRMMSGLLGEPHAALLNAHLATETDTKVRGVILSDAASLVDSVRLFVALGHQPLTVSVFDGRVAHSINITDYDGTHAVFHYWDPWGQGSFLEHAHNAAGVAATPHPTQHRIWLLSFDEMERILYAMVLPEPTVLAFFRLCTLASGVPASLVATYRAIHAANPAADEVAPNRLAKAATYMIAAQKWDTALALLATRAAVHATPVDSSFIDALQRAGIGDPAARIRSLAAPTVAPPQRARAPQRLHEVREDGFFMFFHLEQTASEGATLFFRPSGKKFRELVEVKLSIAADGSITSRELVLDGHFVSDPVNGIFARDIAKSFLHFSVDRTELSEIKGLLDELWSFKPARVPIPGAQRMGASVPAVPSLAYLTYLGNHPAYEQTLPASLIQVRNVRRQDGRHLVFTVANR